jgi:anti-anti-sigma regulatory factor
MPYASITYEFPVVRLCGDLNESSLFYIRLQIAMIIDAAIVQGISRIFIDFSRVLAIDSVFLQVLEDMHMRMLRENIILKGINMTKSIAKSIQELNMFASKMCTYSDNDCFMYNTIEEALRD